MDRYADELRRDAATTSFTVSIYDYNNVRAPAGAMTMQQMMNARRH